MKKFILFLLLISTNVFCEEINITQVPKEILQEIVKDAEKRYPNNYSVQKCIIEQEIKNYLKVLEVKNSLNK
jgi:hypothetical protein